MASAPRAQFVTLAALVVAIGCGGGKPQEASAKSNTAARPLQLAQAPEDPATAQPSGSAAITGGAAFGGGPPTAERVKMDADPQCALQHTDAVHKPEVVVNANGTLKHVFVYVQQGLEGKSFAAPASAATLNQHGCMYEPHVFGVQVGQELSIVNSDATLHNVNCKATKSKPFNLAQPTKGMKTSKQFAAPEIMVKCVCNVHPWMAAYIGAVAHPYFAVTGDEGTFSLAGLPAGTYTVAAWHEKYGEQTQTVTVGDGETGSVAFEFKAQ